MKTFKIYPSRFLMFALIPLHFNLYWQNTTERNWIWENPYYEKIDGVKSTIYPSIIFPYGDEAQFSVNPIFFEKSMGHDRSYGGMEGFSEQLLWKHVWGEKYLLIGKYSITHTTYVDSQIKNRGHKKSQIRIEAKVSLDNELLVLPQIEVSGQNHFLDSSQAPVAMGELNQAVGLALPLKTGDISPRPMAMVTSKQSFFRGQTTVSTIGALASLSFKLSEYEVSAIIESADWNNRRQNYEATLALNAHFP